MNEFQSSPFSIPELRTIVEVAHSPEKLKGLVTEVKFLKSALRNNPDLSWDEYRVMPRSPRTAFEAADVLRSTFDRFKSKRKATVYWQRLYNHDSSATLPLLRSNLNVPDDVQIRSVQFLEDCVVVTMDEKSVNTFFDYVQKKLGAAKAEGLITIPGFISDTLFLKDKDGNSCRVIIADESPGDVIPHEREHIIVQEYYKRKKPKEKKEPEPDLRIKTRDEFRKRLESEKTQDAQTILRVAENYLGPILKDNKLLFYDEVIASSTHLRSIDKEDKTKSGERLRTILENVSKRFDLVEIQALWTSHVYGANMAQVVDGVKDAISELPNLSLMDRLKLEWQLELQAASVAAESRIISNWLSQLWKESHGNAEEFITTLEVIPFKYITSIGYFIGQDPKNLAEQLKQKQNEQYRPQEQSLWRMMLRHAQENEKIKNLPGLTTYSQGIKDALRKKCVHHGKVDMKKLYSTLLKDVVRYYTAKEKDVIKLLYREYSSLFNRLNRLDIPVNQYSWMLRGFIETYGRKLLNFQAINNAILELLAENNASDMSDEVMKTYETLMFGDREKRNGFGHRIINEEFQLWSKLEAQLDKVNKKS